MRTEAESAGSVVAATSPRVRAEDQRGWGWNAFRSAISPTGSSSERTSWATCARMSTTRSTSRSASSISIPTPSSPETSRSAPPPFREPSNTLCWVASSPSSRPSASRTTASLIPPSATSTRSSSAASSRGMRGAHAGPVTRRGSRTTSPGSSPPAPGRRPLLTVPTASTSRSTSGASCARVTAAATRTSTRIRLVFRGVPGLPTTRLRCMTTVRCLVSATPWTPRASGSPSRYGRFGPPRRSARPPPRRGAPCSRLTARRATVGPSGRRARSCTATIRPSIATSSWVDPSRSGVMNTAQQITQLTIGPNVFKYLENVGTLITSNPIEIRQNGLVPFGVAGFNVPSLLSLRYHGAVPAQRRGANARGGVPTTRVGHGRRHHPKCHQQRDRPG